MDPVTGAIILGGLSQAGNLASTLITNKQQRALSLEMYNRQRTDALADWNRQNQFNSPTAQMQRYKEAGLSPHLIYGQTNTAQPVRSSQADVPKLQAPQFQLENIPAMALQLEAQQQNIANLKTQEQLMKADILKKQSETDWKKLQNDFADMTFSTRMQILQNQMLFTDSKNTLTQEQITTQQNKNRLFPLEQRKMNAEISNILARTNLSNKHKRQKIKTMDPVTGAIILGELS